MALVATLGGMLSALYTWAVGSIDGKHVDSSTVVSLFSNEDTLTPALIVAHLAGAWTLVPICLMLVVAVCWRRGPRSAAAVAVLLVGVTASGRLLKTLLERLDPVDGEPTRMLGAGYFPSGHAAAAMALALAVVLLVPRGRARVAAVVAGAAIVATVSLAHLAAQYHHPSDIVAGHLLAGLGAAALSGSITARSAPALSGRRAAAGRGMAPLGVGAGVVMAAAVVTAAPVFGWRVLDIAGPGGVAVAVAPFVVAGTVGALAPGAARRPIVNGGGTLAP